MLCMFEGRAPRAAVGRARAPPARGRGPVRDVPAAATLAPRAPRPPRPRRAQAMST